MFGDKKLWSHVTRTALAPPPARIVTAAVVDVLTKLGSDGVAGAATITKARVDQDSESDLHAALSVTYTRLY